ncbi:MAG: hypothetical protein ACW99A_16540 [Candidatus Kariarchaeaceae archaeon]|jgi:hypothetical protein
MSRKSPKKDDVNKLKDDDLFGDFKPIDEFIESDSFEVIDEDSTNLGKFEITANDKKKKPGHAQPKKDDVSKLREDDLFGDFKPIDEFIESDSFEVTRSQKQAQHRSQKNKEINVSKIKEDDLFGDFKPLDEFIESDSFDVTVSSSNADKQISSTQTPTPPGRPSGGPTPPPAFSVSTPPSINQSLSINSPTPPPTGISPTDPSSVTAPPAIGNSTPPPAFIPTTPPNTRANSVPVSQAESEPVNETKSKLAEIAERRKKITPAKKGNVDDLFDDLDPLELDEP